MNNWDVLLCYMSLPYNPLVFDVEEESFSKIGVTMVQKICEDISYSYAYHLNIITIKIASNRLTV